MIGSQAHINKKVLSLPDCPTTNAKIVEVVNDVYWKEFRRLISEAQTPVIEVKMLGLFYTKPSKLRYIIKKQIKKVRNLRASKYTEADVPYYGIWQSWEKKLKASLLQLNALRKLNILRYEQKGKKIKEYYNEQICRNNETPTRGA